MRDIMHLLGEARPRREFPQEPQIFECIARLPALHERRHAVAFPRATDKIEGPATARSKTGSKAVLRLLRAPHTVLLVGSAASTAGNICPPWTQQLANTKRSSRAR